MHPPEARRSIDGTAMDFIEQVFLVDLWTFHRLGYSLKKGPPPWRGARYLFSVVCVRSTRALEQAFTSVSAFHLHRHGGAVVAFCRPDLKNAVAIGGFQLVAIEWLGEAKTATPRSRPELAEQLLRICV